MATKQRANVASRGILDTIRAETKNQVTNRYSDASFCDDLQGQLKLRKWFALSCVTVAGGLTGFFYFTKQKISKEERNKPFMQRVETGLSGIADPKNFSISSAVPRVKQLTTKFPEFKIEAAALGSVYPTSLSLCERYGIDPSLMSLATVHLKPIEFHLQTCEWLLRDLEDRLELCEEKNLLPNIQALLADILRRNVFEITDEKPHLELFEKLDFEDIANLSEEEKKQKPLTKALLRRARECAHLYLVANWDREKYFDPVSFREGYFGRRHTEQAEGVDIGSRGSSYLFDNFYTSGDSSDLFKAAQCRQSERGDSIRQQRETKQTTASKPAELTSKIPIKESSSSILKKVLSEADLADCMKKLGEYGFVVLRKALAPEEVVEVASKVFSPTAIATEVYDALETFDPNIDCRRPTRGRLHCLLRGSLVEPLLAKIQRVWMPIVYSTLPTAQAFSVNAVQKFRSRGCKATDWITASEADENVAERSRRLFVSDLQLITTDPLATGQFWHSDSLKPGLSVIIPLVDTDAENGANQMLPGTHHLHPETTGSLASWLNKWKKFYSCYQKAVGSVIPDLKAGDILLYDSRVSHRGLGNSSWNTSSCLIYRYDYTCYPPPGQTVVQSNYNRLRASLLHRLSGIYDAL